VAVRGEVEPKEPSQLREIVGYLSVIFTFYANGRKVLGRSVVLKRSAKGNRNITDTAEAWAAGRDASLLPITSRRTVPFYEALGIRGVTLPAKVSLN